MNMANIILPSFHENYPINFFTAELFKNSRDKFYNEINSISFSGSFPYFLWDNNGLEKMYAPREDIIDKLNYLKTNNMALYINCTNSMLKSGHFKDLYCNLVFDLAYDQEVYAICYDTELAKYIKEKYFNVKIVSAGALNKTITESPFDYAIIGFSKNNKDKILKTEQKEKIITELNSYCMNNCSCLDKQSLDKINFETRPSFECNNYAKSFEDIKKTESFASRETMFKMISKGFTNFIISNNIRDKYELLESYLYYLIKPEYIDETRLIAIKSNVPFFNR